MGHEWPGPDAEAGPRDHGEFTLDRPVCSFRHLHFRGQFRRLAAAKRDARGTRAGIDQLLAFSVNWRLPGWPRLQLAGRCPAAWLAGLVQQLPLPTRRAAFSRSAQGETRAEVAQGWALHLVLPPFASPAFLLLFVLSLALHVVFGAKAYNEQRSLAGQSPFSTGAFILSAKFWAITLQTWQAEYLAIALYVVLTIFLRQQDSPESKPVESRNQTTGEANR